MSTPPRLRTEFDDADDSTGLVLWRVTNAWQAAQRAALRPFGLTHVQFVLLASLTWLDRADGDDPVTQQRLAEHAGTDPMMTSQVLRVLEDNGLVTRAPHPVDRRAKALAVTAEGVELVNRAIVAVEACDATFFGSLGARQTEFTRLLRQVDRRRLG